MEIDEILEKILTIKDLSDCDWGNNNLFIFSDSDADFKFKSWLNENDPNLYSEFVKILELSGITEDNGTITDFLNLMPETKTDEELIEIVVSFVIEEKDLLEELNDEIAIFFENENDKYGYNDDYNDYDDYDDYSKEDRYDNYDYYDEDSYN